MKNSKIAWCHHTVNFWWGCTKVSPACAACYALAMAKIFSRGRATWGPDGARWLRENRALDELLKLDASAEKRGVRERVFINSMSDTFEDRDDLNHARTALWLAVYGVRNLDLLLLTKRPENVMRMVPAHWHTDWPAHVWIGTTVENQEYADERIPELVSIPAKVRFLSCEPMLGLVDLERPMPGPDLDQGDRKICRPWYIQSGIHWVIVGGESGPKARAFNTEYAWDLVMQCQRAKVPVFIKQLGAKPYTSNANAMEWPDDTEFRSDGVTAAGGFPVLSDGHGSNVDQWPEELCVREFPPNVKDQQRDE